MLKVELYKFLRNSMVSVTLLLPIVLIGIMLFSFHDMRNEKEAGIFYVIASNIFYTFVIPAYIIAACRHMGEYEYKNNGWKQLMCMPTRKSAVFGGKVLMLIASLSIQYIIFGIAVAAIMRWKGFYFPVTGLATELIVSFLCTLLWVTLFYFLSLMDLSLIVYLGCGAINLIISFFALQSEVLWIYFPLCYQAAIPISRSQDFMIHLIIVSIVLAIVVYYIGFYYYMKKEWS